MDNHQLIHQDSGNCDYYTPPKIIAAAHILLGTIDLDPASSLKANETVKAKRIYTKADNGLAQPWEGNVWMNHPFSRQGNREWIGKLVEGVRQWARIRCRLYLLRRRQCAMVPAAAAPAAILPRPANQLSLP
jgi:hypothetical protein